MPTDANFPVLGSPLTSPIVRSSTFVLEEPCLTYDSIPYIRLSNTPTHRHLNAHLAALCGAESALCTASGMAAITTTLLAVLNQGDHVICTRAPYEGTRRFIEAHLARFGVTSTFVDPTDIAAWRAAVRPETTVMYAESMTNPALRVTDLEAMAEFCRKHGLLSIVDNTIPTPLGCQPLAIGIDVEIHSATKAMNGHSDIAAGVIAARSELIYRIHSMLNKLGGFLDPETAFMLERGLRTLPIRAERQHETATRVARALAELPNILHVSHPSLPSHPDHDVARRVLALHGCLVSFVVEGGRAAAQAVLESLRIAKHAVSFGGDESVAICPANDIHVELSDDTLIEMGIDPGLIRFSVGLEPAESILQDLERAVTSRDALVAPVTA